MEINFGPFFSLFFFKEEIEIPERKSIVYTKYNVCHTRPEKASYNCWSNGYGSWHFYQNWALLYLVGPKCYTLTCVYTAGGQDFILLGARQHESRRMSHIIVCQYTYWAKSVAFSHL